MKKTAFSIALGFILLLWIVPRLASAQPGTAGLTELVSLPPGGEAANDNSHAPGLSPDGRYMAFISFADNLVPEDFNGGSDVFVVDLLSGAVERASVTSQGEEAHGDPSRPSLSYNGGYVLFSSDAPDLVPDDTNAVGDVFVHNRETGRTERVSVASNGAQGDRPSSVHRPGISGDGRFVVFDSEAGNLVPNADNGLSDIYLHDRETGQTLLITRGVTGTLSNGDSEFATISQDGQWIAYTSTASNLVYSDTNETADLFLYDRIQETTIMISIAPDGSQGNDVSDMPALSADGRYIAFVSLADNLVPGDDNGQLDIFVRDRLAGTTERVSVASDGTQSDLQSDTPSLSADGRYVAFYSYATNLVPDDTNESVDVFWHDRQTRETRRVSVASDGAQGNNHSLCSTLSADGLLVGFYSYASTLVPDDLNGQTTDIFVHHTGDWAWDNAQYFPLMFGSGD